MGKEGKGAAHGRSPLTSVGPLQSASPPGSHFLPTILLGGWYIYFLHFTDGDTDL